MSKKLKYKITDEDGKILTSCDKCRHNAGCVDQEPHPPCRYEPGLQPHYVFHLGKYKGKTIASVIDEDAQYLVWMHANVRWFELAPASKNMLLERRPDLAADMRAAAVKHESRFKSWRTDQNEPDAGLEVKEEDK